MGTVRVLSLLLMVPALSRAFLLECVKTGPCSCRSEQGDIDLSPIAQSDGTPLFKDLPDTLGSGYAFSYNPCFPFSEGACTSTAVCQKSPDGTEYFPLGTQDSVTFEIDSVAGNAVIQYTAVDVVGTRRTTRVTLVCDESGGDILTVVGETSATQYAMTLNSSHCCPKRVAPTTTPGPTSVPCTQTGPCTCLSSQGTIDLSPLARANGTPAFQNIADCHSKYAFSYNPCLAFTERDCKNASVCMSNSEVSLQFSLGTQASAQFQKDSITGDLVIVYKSTDVLGTTRTALVRLICDPSGNENSLRVLGETGTDTDVYMMTLTSIYCCPRGGNASQQGDGVRDNKYK